MGLWVYVGIEICTFDVEFGNLFGWLEFGGKEKKEESKEEKREIWERRETKSSNDNKREKGKEII